MEARISWKALALPTEHGGWGMLGEPLLLGLVLAPSAAGACLLVASVSAFLARHPLRLALSDRRRGPRRPRTLAAERIALAYAAVAIAAGAGALTLSGPRPFMPLLAVAPLALTQIGFDARLEGRKLAPQLCGGVALAALAPALMLAGGWALAPSLAAGALVAMKAISSVLYVRTRLRLDRGQPPPLFPALAAHAIPVPAAALMSLAGWAPWVAVAAAAALLLRAVHGLSSRRRIARAQAVGFQELAVGIGFTLILAVGFLGMR
jgi:YwiC-like protein